MHTWSHLAKLQFSASCIFLAIASFCVAVDRYHDDYLAVVAKWLLASSIIYFSLGSFVLVFALRRQHSLIIFFFIPLFVVAGLKLGFESWIASTNIGFYNLKNYDRTLLYTSCIMSIMTWIFTLTLVPLMNIFRCDSTNASWTEFRNPNTVYIHDTMTEI